MQTIESRIFLVPKPDQREALLKRMSEEWPRSPGLHLSLSDVQSRSELESTTCSDLLSVLVDLDVIRRADDGTYFTAA